MHDHAMTSNMVWAALWSQSQARMSLLDPPSCLTQERICSRCVSVLARQFMLPSCACWCPDWHLCVPVVHDRVAVQTRCREGNLPVGILHPASVPHTPGDRQPCAVPLTCKASPAPPAHDVSISSRSAADAPLLHYIIHAVTGTGCL